MFIYTVKRGDSLYKLARLFDMSVSQIAYDNSLPANSYLTVGQSLVINSDTRRVLIERGQTLYSLSVEYGVPLEEMLSENSQLDPFNILPGQPIKIPVKDLPPYDAVFNGYAYPNISSENLACFMPVLDFISPFAYGILPDGSIQPPNGYKTAPWAKNNNDRYPLTAGKRVLLTLANITDGSFSSETLSAVFSGFTPRIRLIESVLYEIDKNHYDGLNLDFEYIYPENRSDYNYLVEELSMRLHAKGKILVTALAPKYRADQPGLLYEAHDYAHHGKYADHVVLMTYEWGYVHSAPMPVQPINEVRKVLSYAVSEIPSKKILLGMPNYGYEWKLPYKKGEPAKTVGLSQAVQNAITHGAEIIFDEKTMTPHYYFTENGTARAVYFDDPRSIAAKLSLIREFKLGGASIWTINRCFRPMKIIAENGYEL